MRKNVVSLQDLRMMLASAEARAVAYGPEGFIGRMDAASEVKRLKARIARRERDEAYRDCGLTKVRGSLGGTYWE